MGKLLVQGYRLSKIRSVAFSPDGKRIAAGSDDGVHIWDVEKGKPAEEPFRESPIYSITSVAFSPDGRSIVSGSEDQGVRIWDAYTGKPVGEPFQGHTKYVNSLDGTARIWDASTGKLVRKPFQGPTDRISSVAFSPDGRRIVSGSYDQSVLIWDAGTE